VMQAICLRFFTQTTTRYPCIHHRATVLCSLLNNCKPEMNYPLACKI